MRLPRHSCLYTVNQHTISDLSGNKHCKKQMALRVKVFYCMMVMCSLNSEQQNGVPVQLSKIPVKGHHGVHSHLPFTKENALNSLLEVASIFCKSQQHQHLACVFKIEIQSPT
ncbi:hypothetical protein PoB_002366800 [Plakobranchus ocellatus]|uniref:Uncharacterized protein n=1 Tax=Plakobranchus ocellatus TaxID=259542 RepID=A0AAV3ZRT3_9GAST|nr:hypothetical protein PoB_002366800 [Plakobranchus ocellatus]